MLSCVQPDEGSMGLHALIRPEGGAVAADGTGCAQRGLRGVRRLDRAEVREGAVRMVVVDGG